MTPVTRSRFVVLALISGGVLLGYVIANTELASSPFAGAEEHVARDASSPESTAPATPEERPDAWYPRTEKVPSDGIFVVALGTGMPTPITKAQKSSAWYVELGDAPVGNAVKHSGSQALPGNPLACRLCLLS